MSTEHIELIVGAGFTPASTRLTVEVVAQVIRDLERESNMIILGRASNHVLHDLPSTFNVSIVVPLPFKVQTIMKRESLSKEAAEKLINDQERARASYFRRFYKSEPNDQLAYHLVVNSAALSSQKAARVIVDGANSLPKGLS